jgi:hypothetical protein
MKYWIFGLLCIGTVITCNASGDGGTTAEQNHSFTNVFIGKIYKDMHINSVLGNLCFSSEIAFCREATAATNRKTLPVAARRDPHERDWSTLSNKSVEVFLAALDSEGFVCTQRDKVILVTDPELLKSKNNPLNSKLQGFKFKGTLGAFLSEFGAQTQGGHPDTSGASGPLSSAIFEINISEEITARDLLMHFSSKYGLGWTAIIAEKSPVYLWKDSTNDTTFETKGSRWSLVFYPSKRFNKEFK